MNAIVVAAPRLPYSPDFETRYGDMGVNVSTWRPLVEAIFPAAKSLDSVLMALAYCKARKLDVFKRPVHIVPVWSADLGRMVETVWPAIAELRTTAMRTGEYAGTEPFAYGPNVTETLGGVEITYPEWAQLTIYRFVKGVKCAFVAPEVLWKESYATAKRDTAAPNAMWRKRPKGQLQKCAEAAALRFTFPEEIGNDYAAEEMEGRVIGAGGDPMPGEPRAPRRIVAGFMPPSDMEGHAEAAEIDADTGEIIEQFIPAEDQGPEDDDLPEGLRNQSTPRAAPSANNGGAEGGDGEFDLIAWADGMLAWFPSADAATITKAWAEHRANGRLPDLQRRDTARWDALAQAKDQRIDALRARR